MDSANSGSLQSSSGGDEEYDSRAAVPPPFMPLPSQPQPSFDPFQNYLQSQLLNTTWSAPSILRSEPNPNPNTQAQANLFSMENSISNLSRSQQQGQNLISQPGATRNPKKRTRASRRAPTTVLTTDTSNFRAMVQEFTGIPAPPFNNHISSHFSKTSRLDLFGTRSPTSFDLLHRPFPQKLPNQAFFGGPASSNSANHDQSLVNSSAGNFSSSNLFNIQNQNPLISSLLHNNATFGLSNSSNFLVNSSKPDHHQGSLSFGNVESNGVYGLGQGNHVNATLTGLPNLISSDQTGQKDRSNEYSDNNRSNYGFSATAIDQKEAEKGGGGCSEGMLNLHR